ncbi:MAG: flavin monoamine oxidase family protein [Paracoccaceae bacterium]
MLDVVVIGSGLAGAAAALRLTDAGRTVTVIEARGRLGGRTYSRGIGDSSEVMEFGGSWMTPWHDRIQALAARFDTGLRPTNPVVERRWHDGQVLRTDAPVAAEAMEAYKAGMAAIRQDALDMKGTTGRMHIGSNWANLSFSDYLEARALPASARHEFMAWWAISGSADPTRVNALDTLFFASLHDGTLDGMICILTHTIEGGVGTLVGRAIAASGAEVVLGDAVAEVTDWGDRVRLRLSSGRQVEALQVIVAVGVNALATIRFDPPLRARQQQVTQDRHMGRAIKMLLRVSGVRPGILVTGEAEGLRWMFSERTFPDGTTAIIAFGLYDEVKDTSFAAMSRAVSRFFPEATLLSHDWHDWVRDPYSSGTWVSHGLGQSPLYGAEAWAALGRLHFATSDIARRESGWFEGAVIAGEAAADAILAADAEQT